jgi:Cu-Zn family superoxide dismutase
MIRNRLALAGLIVLTFVFQGAVQSPSRAAQSLEAKAVLYDMTGIRVGEATFSQEAGKVRVRVVINGLPSGWHGFHIHSVGDCTPPAHTTSGGHFNPTGATHPNHAGDLPILHVNSDGTAEASFTTSRFELLDLFDNDLSALIIHGSPDNYANIQDRYRSSADGAPASGPDTATLSTGDAGARIACGLIERVR